MKKYLNVLSATEKERQLLEQKYQERLRMEALHRS